MVRKKEQLSEQQILNVLKQVDSNKYPSLLLMPLKTRLATYINSRGQKTYIEDLLTSETDFLFAVSHSIESREIDIADILTSRHDTGTLRYDTKRSLQTLLKEASGDKTESGETRKRTFLGSLAQMGNKVSAKIGGLIGHPPEELFFKSIHFYGLSDEFEHEDYISQFPIEFRQKYNTWKTDNKNLTASYQELNAQAEIPPSDLYEVPEEIALFKQAQAAQAIVPDIIKGLQRAGDTLESGLNAIGRTTDNQQSEGEEIETLRAGYEVRANDITSANEKTALQTAQERLAEAQGNGNTVAVEFYSFIVEQQSAIENSKIDKSFDKAKLDNQLKMEIPQFISRALKNYAELDEEDKFFLKLWLKNTVFSIDDRNRQDVIQNFSNADPAEKEYIIQALFNAHNIIASHVNPVTDLFHLAYLVDAQEILHKMIGGQHYPKPVLKAYREWKETPKAVAFKTACKVGEIDKAWRMLSLNNHENVNDLKNVVEEISEPLPMSEPHVLSPNSLAYTVSRYRDIASTTQDIYQKRLYSFLVSLLDVNEIKKHIHDKNWEVNNHRRFNEFVSESGEKLSLEDRIECAKQLQIHVDPAGMNASPHWKSVNQRLFRILPPHHLFRAVHIVGLVSMLEECFKEKFIPVGIQTAYNQWKKTNKNQNFIAECAARNNPKAIEVAEAEPAAPAVTSISSNDNPPSEGDILPSPIDPRLFIHPVEQRLVMMGNRTDTTGIQPVNRTDAQPTVKTAIENIHKTKNLYMAMLADQQISRIDVYRDVRIQEDDKKTTYPYDIIQITKNDGSLTRIVVCDFENHLTYVERDATPYTKGDTVQIADILANPKVWTAKHKHSEHLKGEVDKTWLEKVKYFFETELDKIPIQNKYINDNSGLAGRLVQAFAKTYMITGATPNAHDMTELQFGTIKTSYSRQYSALQNKRIKGLEECTTFNQLFNYLAKGENAPMPWLLKFENKPQITAQQVLDAVEEYEQGMDESLTAEAYELVLIDKEDIRIDKKNGPDLRRTGVEIDEAFRRGAVDMSDGLIPEGSNPDSLQEFLKLAKSHQHSILELKAA